MRLTAGSNTVVTSQPFSLGIDNVENLGLVGELELSNESSECYTSKMNAKHVIQRGMSATKRPLGISLIFVGGLAFIDWVLSFVHFIGSHQPIVDLVFYGDLDTSGGEPILFTIGRWLCPGNGYAWFCDTLWVFLLLLGISAVVICLAVNLTRGVASTGRCPLGGNHRWLRLHNLAFFASIVCVVGLCWTLIHFINGPDYPTAVSVAYLVFATVTPPLFILMTIAAGRRLCRTRG